MVNRMRHTRSHTGNRRSHHALKERALSLCPNCGAPRMNHRMCVNCGKYKSRMVIDVHAALLKKEKKMKERNATLPGSSKEKAAETK